MNEVIERLSRAMKDQQPAVLVTVVEVSGASPAKAGAQLLLLSGGEMLGTVGGGLLEAAILEDAKAVLHQQDPRLKHYTLEERGQDAVGSLCGGEIRVFLQPFNPPPKLVIVGGGYIGRPLKAMGEAAGFEVVVVDVEPGITNVSGLGEVDINEDSYVVLITTDHISDEAALRQSLDTPARYIGMIGSLAKCRTILDHLREDGFDDEALARIYAPIGLDLGGSTPGEIAAAILAEVIAFRRGVLSDIKGVTVRRVKRLSSEEYGSGE